MLNRLSVSILLKSVIALMGATVVIMLALGARDSWTRLNTANRISGVANVSAYMFTALEQFAGRPLQHSARSRQRAAIRDAGPADQGARDKEMPALDSLLAALAAIRLSGSGSGNRRPRVPEIKSFADLQEQTAAAMAQPKSARPPELAEAYGKEGDGMMAALDSWGTRLVKYISLQDPYVDQLLEIKQLAWTMRNAAGNQSLVVSNGISGIAPPPDALIGYNRNDAAFDIAWAAVQDIASRLPPTSRSHRRHRQGQNGLFRQRLSRAAAESAQAVDCRRTDRLHRRAMVAELGQQAYADARRRHRGAGCRQGAGRGAVRTGLE